jgi:hypothetical protein
MKCKDCKQFVPRGLSGQGLCINVAAANLYVISENECQMQPSVKPVMSLKGLGGSIFSILGEASECLRKADQKDKIQDMRQKVYASHSYDEALRVIGSYVNFANEMFYEEEVRDND